MSARTIWLDCLVLFKKWVPRCSFVDWLSLLSGVAPPTSLYGHFSDRAMLERCCTYLQFLGLLWITSVNYNYPWWEEGNKITSCSCNVTESFCGFLRAIRNLNSKKFLRRGQCWQMFVFCFFFFHQVWILLGTLETNYQDNYVLLRRRVQLKANSENVCPKTGDQIAT